MPSGIHTWTQSDHYALARGFVENDLNFFRPQTLTYPYHYPATFNPDNPSLVTAVDFPIHNYIPAVIMKITGSQSALIYHLYMLFISMIGLIFLFRLSLLINKSVTLSLLIVAFVACSPVFTFYQIRFIPSVPSLCTTIIGLYYGMLYRQTKQIRHFALGLIFLGLSAMTRLTLVIPFAAWLGQAFFDLFKETTDRKKRIFWMCLTGCIFLGSYGYNYYLRTEFGSLFLSKPMPATYVSQLLEITTYVIKTWKTDYLTKAHYLLIALGIIYWIYNRIRNGKQRFFGTPNWFVFFLFSGSIAFYLLMCRQFPAHDYYFIDTFLVPIIVFLIFLSRAIAPQTQLAKRIAFGFTFISISGMLLLNLKKQEFRHESERWGENNRINKNFEHSEELLNKLHIGKKEELVILDRMAWNVPFYFMHRTGYVVMTVNKKKLEESLDLPVKYYVFQNETFLLNAYKMNPKIIERLKILGTDGKITICKKTSPQKKSLFEFLQLENKKPVFERQLSDSMAVEWEIKGHATDKNTFDVLASEEFGPVLKLRNSPWFKTYRVVYFSGQIKWNQQQDIECVTSFTENGELTTYKVFSVKAALKPTQNWQNFRFLITVPATQANINELSVYFWNTKKANYSVRNVSCKIY
ncbi:MAG: hypothetical protein A3E30_07850 [Fluviicola sp. RIFCSPHIGHO2_12_FULL_43_24]|nr:MAG: hypothetical protein A3E30_07850 [Fluviicola sp. RIFCSPHIGHO2_12_FULL_43_24]